MNRLLLGSTLAILVGATLPAASEPPSPSVIGELVKQLGSDDFAAREKAVKQLAKMPAAIPLLREAANGSESAEVRVRATAILKTFAAGAARERFQRQKEYAKRRQVDRLIESLVAWREAVGDDERKLVRQFATDVLARVKKEFGPNIPKIEVPGLFRKNWVPPEKMPLMIGAKVGRPPLPDGDVIAEFMSKDAGSGVHVSRDGAATENGPSGPVFLMNGSYRFSRTSNGLSGSGGSLIICNGDYTANNRLYHRNDVILCTGNVSLALHLEGSLVIAGGEITIDPSFVMQGSRLFPKEKKLHDILKYYDAAKEGLHVTAEGKTVTVAKVDTKTPFAIGGIQTGDRILRVNDQIVANLRDLNKFLCRAEVGHTGRAVIAVARKENVFDVIIKLAK
jgi:hypothetical protein